MNHRTRRSRLAASTFAVILAATLSGCAGTMNVDTSGPPPRPLEVGSYAWTTGAGGVVGDLQLARNAGVDQRIREVIDDEMAARGWQLVQDGGDVGLAYVAAVERELEVDEVNDLFRYRGRRWALTSVEIREFDQGTLVIDLSDPETGEPLWRGAAEAELHRDDPDYRDRKLQEAVRAILAEMPTGSGR